MQPLCEGAFPMARMVINQRTRLLPGLSRPPVSPVYCSLSQMSPHSHPDTARLDSTRLFGCHSLFFSMPRHAALACLLFGLALRSRSPIWRLDTVKLGYERRGWGGRSRDQSWPSRDDVTVVKRDFCYCCLLLFAYRRVGQGQGSDSGHGNGNVNKKPNSKLEVEATPRTTKGGEERSKNGSADMAQRIPLK